MKKSFTCGLLPLFELRFFASIVRGLKTRKRTTNLADDFGHGILPPLNTKGSVKRQIDFKSRKTRKKGKPAVVDPTDGIYPYPLFPGLPDVPLEAVLDTKTAVFAKFDFAANYIDKIKMVFNEQLNIIKSPHMSETPFRVAVKLCIPTEHCAKDHQDVKYVVGMGRSPKLRTALNLARADLAERLYRSIKDAEQYLSENARKLLKKSEVKFIPISLSSQLREKITETSQLLNETGVFQTLIEQEERTGKWNRFDFVDSLPRKFRQLPPSITDSLVPPARETSKLPIWKLFHRIINSIETNNVTVLSAATGSGKTTQIPQYILDYYAQVRERFEKPPSVLITQPRRIAAKSVAQRIADERDRMLPGGGQAVGYSVRFDSKFPSSTKDGSILLCTAGILLRRLQREPDLRSVTHLILDEVHERDVFTDILLLVTRNILKKRPDLRVILMSATMDAGKFIQYFKSKGYSVGTVLDIEGTNYPISESYLEDIINISNKEGLRLSSLSPETNEYVNAELTLSDCGTGPSELIIHEQKLQNIPFDLMANVVRYIIEKKPPGAILIFLPGWEEINELHQALGSKLAGFNVEYHLLHSTSPIGSADAAFKRPEEGVHKIILATNIAESSVTIPDVVYIIDSGKQKVMHYDQKLRMNVLEPCWISKANFRQRLGRAGRCQPGDYYGVFSRKRSKILPEQTLPELLRLGLDEVCLNLKAMGLYQPAVRILATAIDAPERSAIKAAVDRLCQIGAIDEDEMLTPLGRLLANIPVHPGKTYLLVSNDL